MKKAQNLLLWSVLMMIATIIVVLVCVIPGFEYLFFSVTLTASIISVVWVGVLLHATSR